MVYMYHNFLIHSSADGHLGSFHVLAIVNSVLQWTLGCLCLFPFWFPWCVCPAVRLLGHMQFYFQFLNGISTLFSIVAMWVCTPTNSGRGSLFSTPSPAFTICRLFHGSHSEMCEMIPYCGFDLHFSNNEWYWAFFHVFISHLYVFFGEMSV